MRTNREKTMLILILLFAFILNISCVSNKDHTERNTARLSRKLSPVVLIGIDGSGSYDYYDKGKIKLKKLVDDLPDGSKIIVRWISSDSYQDSNSIITKELPKSVEAGKNAFDKRKRIERIKAQLAIKKRKEEIWTHILKTQYPKSKFTDLYGFFLVVSERINQYSKEKRPVFLVILSDLKNTKKKYKKHVKKDCLDGAKVYLLAFETTTPELKNRWVDIFTNQLGTEAPVFMGLDEEIPDIFSQRKRKPGK